jgi:hypothetical protein
MIEFFNKPGQQIYPALQLLREELKKVRP